MIAMKHNEAIRFRISSELRKELEAAASIAEESLSAYMRKAARAHAYHRDPEIDKLLLSELIKLRKELRSIGNNLNQVARKINANGELEVEGELAVLQSRLAEKLSDMRQMI